MKKTGYMDRAMKSRDPRFASILGKLGYERRDMVALKADLDLAPDDMSDLRKKYEAAVGKRPFHRWDADTLREKIAAGKGSAS